MKSIDAERRPVLAEPPCSEVRRAVRIVVVGCGHVGLVTAACLAGFGHVVVAVDSDAALVAQLSRGDLQQMQEPDLAQRVRAQLAARRLSFAVDIEEAMQASQLVFVAVGAPVQADGSIDTRAVDEVAQRLSTAPDALRAVVIQSTVPPGTARRFQASLQRPLAPRRVSATVLVCPSFMQRGCAVNDFMAPARIVIGDDLPSGAARKLLLDVFAPMIEAGAAVLTMDTCSAELSKQAANAMLATRISFINEIAAIAAATGADIESVCEGIGSDRRIGPAGLRPGSGYGGPFLTRDVASLRETARRHNLRADLLLATERVNDRQRCWGFSALRRDFGLLTELRGLRVAVWGLAYKPGQDDIRKAPSMALIDRLVRAGVLVSLYDPRAIANARREIAVHNRVHWAQSAELALKGTDVLMLVTEWPEFTGFDPAIACSALRLRTVYDCRNSLDTKKWGAAGLRVVQVGRPLGRVEASGSHHNQPPVLETLHDMHS